MRFLAASLVLIFSAQNVVFAYSAESTFWKERRKAMHSSPNQLADNDEPAKPAPAPNDPTTLLASLPQVNSNLATMPLSPKAFSDLGISPDAQLDLKATQVANSIPEWLQTSIAPYATIQGIHLSRKPDAKTVLILQDVHMHAEAQRNIAGVVESMGRALDGKQERMLVALESTDVPLGDFSRYNRYPRRKIQRAIAEALLDKHVLKGVELAAIGYGHDGADGAVKLPFDLTGVDSASKYAANVRALQQAVPLKQKAETALSDLNRELASLKKSHYDKNLAMMDAKSASFQDGKLGLPAYASYLDSIVAAETPNLKQLISAALLEQIISFNKVERERKRLFEELVRKMSKEDMKQLLQISSLFRAGLVSYTGYYDHLRSLTNRYGVRLNQYPEMSLYIQYVLKSESIDHQQLFAELKENEQRVVDKLATTREQKELVAMSQEAALMLKLSDHVLTEDEWRTYASRRSQIAQIPARLAAIGGRSPESMLVFERTRPVFDAFYENALARNDEMSHRTAERLQRGAYKTAVLIAGGFHSSGLMDRLTQEPLNVFLVTPKITKLEDGPSSLDFLARNQLPLNELFKGEKLFLDVPAPTMPMGGGSAKPMGDLFGATEKALEKDGPQTEGDVTAEKGAQPNKTVLNVDGQDVTITGKPTPDANFDPDRFTSYMAIVGGLIAYNLMHLDLGIGGLNLAVLMLLNFAFEEIVHLWVGTSLGLKVKSRGSFFWNGWLLGFGVQFDESVADQKSLWATKKYGQIGFFLNGLAWIGMNYFYQFTSTSSLVLLLGLILFTVVNEEFGQWFKPKEKLKAGWKSLTEKTKAALTPAPLPVENISPEAKSFRRQFSSRLPFIFFMQSMGGAAIAGSLMTYLVGADGMITSVLGLVAAIWVALGVGITISSAAEATKLLPTGRTLEKTDMGYVLATLLSTGATAVVFMVVRSILDTETLKPAVFGFTMFVALVSVLFSMLVWIGTRMIASAFPSVKSEDEFKLGVRDENDVLTYARFGGLPKIIGWFPMRIGLGLAVLVALTNFVGAVAILPVVACGILGIGFEYVARRAAVRANAKSTGNIRLNEEAQFFTTAIFSFAIALATLFAWLIVRLDPVAWDALTAGFKVLIVLTGVAGALLPLIGLINFEEEDYEEVRGRATPPAVPAAPAANNSTAANADDDNGNSNNTAPAQIDFGAAWDAADTWNDFQLPVTPQETLTVLFHLAKGERDFMSNSLPDQNVDDSLPGPINIMVAKAYYMKNVAGSYTYSTANLNSDLKEIFDEARDNPAYDEHLLAAFALYAVLFGSYFIDEMENDYPAFLAGIDASYRTQFDLAISGHAGAVRKFLLAGRQQQTPAQPQQAANNTFSGRMRLKPKVAWAETTSNRWAAMFQNLKTPSESSFLGMSATDIATFLLIFAEMKGRNKNVSLPSDQTIEKLNPDNQLLYNFLKDAMETRTGGGVEQDLAQILARVPKNSKGNIHNGALILGFSVYLLSRINDKDMKIRDIKVAMSDAKLNVPLRVAISLLRTNATVQQRLGGVLQAERSNNAASKSSATPKQRSGASKKSNADSQTPSNGQATSKTQTQSQQGSSANIDVVQALVDAETWNEAGIPKTAQELLIQMFYFAIKDKKLEVDLSPDGALTSLAPNWFKPIRNLSRMAALGTGDIDWKNKNTVNDHLKRIYGNADPAYPTPVIVSFVLYTLMYGRYFEKAYQHNSQEFLNKIESPYGRYFEFAIKLILKSKQVKAAAPLNGQKGQSGTQTKQEPEKSQPRKPSSTGVNIEQALTDASKWDKSREPQNKQEALTRMFHFVMKGTLRLALEPDDDNPVKVQLGDLYQIVETTNWSQTLNDNDEHNFGGFENYLNRAYDAATGEKDKTPLLVGFVLAILLYGHQSQDGQNWVVAEYLKNPKAFLNGIDTDYVSEFKEALNLVLKNSANNAASPANGKEDTIPPQIEQTGPMVPLAGLPVPATSDELKKQLARGNQPKKPKVQTREQTFDAWRPVFEPLYKLGVLSHRAIDRIIATFIAPFWEIHRTFREDFVENGHGPLTAQQIAEGKKSQARMKIATYAGLVFGALVVAPLVFFNINLDQTTFLFRAFVFVSVVIGDSVFFGAAFNVLMHGYNNFHSELPERSQIDIDVQTLEALAGDIRPLLSGLFPAGSTSPVGVNYTAKDMLRFGANGSLLSNQTLPKKVNKRSPLGVMLELAKQKYQGRSGGLENQPEVQNLDGNKLVIIDASVPLSEVLKVAQRGATLASLLTNDEFRKRLTNASEADKETAGKLLNLLNGGKLALITTDEYLQQNKGPVIDESQALIENQALDFLLTKFRQLRKSNDVSSVLILSGRPLGVKNRQVFADLAITIMVMVPVMKFDVNNQAIQTMLIAVQA